MEIVVKLKSFVKSLIVLEYESFTEGKPETLALEKESLILLHQRQRKKR